jgi:hypothetical protein
MPFPSLWSNKSRAICLYRIPSSQKDRKLISFPSPQILHIPTKDGHPGSINLQPISNNKHDQIRLGLKLALPPAIAPIDAYKACGPLMVAGLVHGVFVF